jgi:hypothetical protein
MGMNGNRLQIMLLEIRRRAEAENLAHNKKRRETTHQASLGGP